MIKGERYRNKEKGKRKVSRERRVHPDVRRQAAPIITSDVISLCSFTCELSQVFTQQSTTDNMPDQIFISHLKQILRFLLDGLTELLR